MEFPLVSYSSCSPSAIPLPSLFGAEILSLHAAPVSNFSGVPNFDPSNPIPNLPAVCNITVTYTHPGENDTINVEAWLPFENYNGRFQAVGGAGWNAGRCSVSYEFMEIAISEGYATSSTDSGFGFSSGDIGDPSQWALLSPGNVDLYLLQDFASVSLSDQAIITKDLVKSFYGQPPQYSYWFGGSQGGRQGLMLAQRYPDAYDGISAAFPAIYWSQIFLNALWPAVFMESTAQFPHSCELDYLTNASISACDGNDGVLDGIVVDPTACDFDPFTQVGKSFNCSLSGTVMEVSNAAASVVNATWAGPRSSTGDPLWYGPNKGADLTGNTLGTGIGVAATTCSSNGTCVPALTSLFEPWVPLFVEKDPTFNLLNLTHEQYDNIFHASIQQYDSIIGTSDPDLSQFRNKGGKIITYHGQIDGLIPTRGTQQYYDAITDLIPEVQDFCRYFEAPGIPHSFSGPGGAPNTVPAAVRAWVENGTVPDTLPLTFPVNGTSGVIAGGPGSGRFLCAYPKRSQFNATCGNSASTECFYCA